MKKKFQKFLELTMTPRVRAYVILAFISSLTGYLVQVVSEKLGIEGSWPVIFFLAGLIFSVVPHAIFKALEKSEDTNE